MSDVYIKIKMNEKEVKLKSSTLNNSNLAMIFRLDLNQVIYISSEEGEIILRSDTGFCAPMHAKPEGDGVGHRVGILTFS